MKPYNVIASGSTGNAVLYCDSILVDIGVPFAALRPYLYKIQLVCLSHLHTDHFNKSTLFRLCKERPTIRVGCCEWMLPELIGLKNVDLYQIGTEYQYNGEHGTSFSILPVKLYHDTPQCGFKIFKGDHKIFHATDTCTLAGIEAKNYTIYAIEHSYDADTIFGVIEEKESRGVFAYERGVIQSHLSEQAARQFIFNNAGENYEVLRLHESRREYSKI